MILYYKTNAFLAKLYLYILAILIKQKRREVYEKYSYDEDKRILAFSNIWQGKDIFSIKLTLREFKNIFSNKNINHIVEHFSKVYGDEKIKVKR